MAAGILMPKAGITVETCIITKWRKQVGDTVNVGDIIFDYETDKATFECEATESGEILEIFFNDGDEVPCLVNVCAVGKAGEDCSALRPAAEGEEAPAAAPAEEKAEAAAPAAAAAEAAPAAPVSTGDIKISPRAKALAESKHIDPHFAAPTGPYGRVIERDIRKLIETGVGATAAAFDGASAAGMASGTGLGGRVSVNDLNAPAAPAAAPAAAAEPAVEFEDVKFSSMRKAISKSMTISLSTIPQLTHNTTFDATELMAYRAKLKANAEKLGLPNITLNDMVLFVVSRVLMNYADLNAHMLDEKTIRQFKDVHLGMAVDTDRGLMVPTIRFANKKSLAEISAEAKALAAQCKAGNISPDLLSGATFTISNVGSLGIESFTPVINPPQTGILGVDTLMTKVRMVNGQLQGYQAMGLSLTYDHRALDGTPASKFLRDVAFGLENFSLFLSK